MISRILLVTDNSVERQWALGALTRCGAQVLLANNESEAKAILKADSGELPQLVILHLGQNHSNPLNLYKTIRSQPSTQSVPIIIMVETPIERTMVNNLGLTRCCCFLGPLNYGLLIFALPSLDIEIKDSILYQKYPTEQDSIAALHDRKGSSRSATSNA